MCLNDCIDLSDTLGSSASGATASLVAKNGTKKLSQPFEELQGSNSEFKLIINLIITSGQILVFEVSKRLYRSA